MPQAYTHPYPPQIAALEYSEMIDSLAQKYRRGESPQFDGPARRDTCLELAALTVSYYHADYDSGDAESLTAEARRQLDSLTSPAPGLRP